MRLTYPKLFTAFGIVLVLGLIAFVFIHPKSAIPQVAAFATSTQVTAVQINASPAALISPTHSGAAAINSSVTSSTTLQTAPHLTTSSDAVVIILINGASYSTPLASGETLSQAMQTLMQKGDFTYTQKNYPGLGEFVDSINGVTSNNGHYWFLYKDGKISDTGISSTYLNAGDVIEWKYDRNY